eukprot:TRINITY_DN21104_c1_g1_i1.p2 TRINITY_DN21104_c1_g1~~TRINITY_DN21104_c1_g1_i1.p2  ORF type:complete len:104 (+),score=1.88 TRINITY_DN21104_c1_g1_i1:198-509(+)
MESILSADRIEAHQQQDIVEVQDQKVNAFVGVLLLFNVQTILYFIAFFYLSLLCQKMYDGNGIFFCISYVQIHLQVYLLLQGLRKNLEAQIYLNTMISLFFND